MKELLVNISEIETIIETVEGGHLSGEEIKQVIGLLRLLLKLIITINDKESSIARLKRLLFGPKSEKRHNGQQPEG